MLLEGKTVVITGANRGIGRATTELMARNGARIFACARQPSEGFADFLVNLERDSGARVSPIYFDLNDEAAMKAGIKEIQSDGGVIDVIVNNAGTIQTAPALMTTKDALQSNLSINFLAPLIFTQALARTMVRRKSGSIVNVSSSAAIEGNEGRLAYASAKSAMITATKVMARELGVLNIRVNAVAPGLTQTDMMTASTKEDALRDTLARTAMKRVGQPAEIAGAILFLASDLSAYVTGQVLRVDGGM